jgi:hypothetical protein
MCIDLFKILPDDWILMLTFIYNIIFTNNYPKAWSLAKVFTIFKKGSKADPENYRGISFMSAIAKVYDMILSDRFSLWYKPLCEQAGAQKNRGCEEQILSVRLLIDIARKTKDTLYIAFIDYQKAYDKINRTKLIERLDTMGCGTTFLMALQQSMSSIGIIGGKEFQTSSGVKQGGSTSCSLFTSYIDPTISAVKSTGPDGWLKDSHILLFMDDTVVFATTRNKMEEKLLKPKEMSDKIGMIIHPTKSKFSTINTNDTKPFKCNDIVIVSTKDYVYLGAPISDNTISRQIEIQLQQKYTHITKFSSFLFKNSDCPFPIKKQVWQSALKAAVYYGCETWLTKDLQLTEKPYLATLRHMLNVRQTTCSDTMLVELGLGNARSMIKDRQTYFLKKIDNRTSKNYIHDIIKLAIQKKTTMGKQILCLRNNHADHTTQCLNNLKDKILTATTTKRETYVALNPNLQLQPIYNDKCIPEQIRMAYTRMRLSSHNLKIETGRWARTPRDQRTCQCGEIQTEEHVLLGCPQTLYLRENIEPLRDCNTIADVFKLKYYKQIAELCYKVLKTFT